MKWWMEVWCGIMLKRIFFMLTVFSLLAAVSACGAGREQPSGESQVANRMGDLRARGEDLFSTPPAAGDKGTASQSDFARTSGTAEGGAATEAPAWSETGSGAVSAGQAEIEQHYAGRLQSLASSCESRIMGLYASGIQELRSIPASDSQARSAAAERYYSSGRALEAECDGQFYTVLAAFEGELQNGGHPLDKAREVQAIYESSKQARSGLLMDMALSSAAGAKKQ